MGERFDIFTAPDARKPGMHVSLREDAARYEMELWSMDESFRGTRVVVKVSAETLKWLGLSPLLTLEQIVAEVLL